MLLTESNIGSFKNYLILECVQDILFEDLMSPLKTKAKKVNSKKSHNLVVKVKPSSLKVFIKTLSADYKYIKHRVSDLLNLNNEEYYIVALTSTRSGLKKDIERLIVPGVKIFDVRHKNYT